MATQLPHEHANGQFHQCNDSGPVTKIEHKQGGTDYDCEMRGGNNIWNDSHFTSNVKLSHNLHH